MVGETVVDGSGGPAVPGTIAIASGRIASVAVLAVEGRDSLDATGLVVAPGFIDAHDGAFADGFDSPSGHPRSTGTLPPSSSWDGHWFDEVRNPTGNPVVRAV